MDNTVILNDPKFIRYNKGCFYCFGNCDLCKLKFMCWSGTIRFEDEIKTKYIDARLERIAFGNVIGRIILHAVVDNGKFYRTRYSGNQLTQSVFIESELLYLNDKGMVCCTKRPRSVHHVKNWD